MIARVCFLVFAFVFLTFSSFPVYAETLPLKNVIISSSGLAVYGHEGKVQGDTELELSVRLDQVDDLLKSLVVMQPENAKLEGVSLPGREPLSQIFLGLPFNETEIRNYPALLNAMRGAMVSIDDGFITGRLMGVAEEESRIDDAIVTRYRVSIHTDAGIKTAVLEDIGNLKFTEKEVQAQLDRALKALFTNRVQDERTLTIKTSGPERNVAMIYILDAPLWKSSYRLLLPEADEETATLQGWAVLENTTGHDWEDVNLTLMSGSPVTYHQALYESYFTDRPELPVKIMDQVMPRADRGAVSLLGEKLETRQELRQINKTRDSMVRSKGIAGAPPMPQAEMSAPSMAYGDMAAEQEAAPMHLSQVQAATADETASQMVFHFPQTLDLPAGNTLMVPFSDRKVPAEQVYLYQPDVNARHPLASILISNDSDSGLPPGIITLYDAGGDQALHVGDAEMPLVPTGENRFISYALDTSTLIDREDSSDRRLGLITIVRGSLHQKVLWLNTTKYTIEAPEDEARTVVIEHPRRQDWELDTPEGAAGDIEKTETHYRVRFRVEAGKTEDFAITMRKEAVESVALTNIAPHELTRRIKAAVAGKDIPSDVRKVLEEIVELRSRSYAIEQQIARINQERQQIFRDQNRLRQNLSNISLDNPQCKSYLSEMEEQEDRLDELAGEEKDLKEILKNAQDELDNYIRNLKL